MSKDSTFAFNIMISNEYGVCRFCLWPKFKIPEFNPEYCPCTAAYLDDEAYELRRSLDYGDPLEE